MIERSEAVRVICHTCPTGFDGGDRKKGPFAEDEIAAVRAAGERGWMRLKPYGGSVAVDLCPGCWQQIIRDLQRNSPLLFAVSP